MVRVAYQRPKSRSTRYPHDMCPFSSNGSYRKVTAHTSQHTHSPTTWDGPDRLSGSEPGGEISFALSPDAAELTWLLLCKSTPEPI